MSVQLSTCILQMRKPKSKEVDPLAAGWGVISERRKTRPQPSWLPSDEIYEAKKVT